MSKQKVAFIGLGVMGYPMAGHLAKAGSVMEAEAAAKEPKRSNRPGTRSTRTMSGLGKEPGLPRLVFDPGVGLAHALLEGTGGPPGGPPGAPPPGP